MTQKNEIRGFRAGRFFSENHDAVIKVSRSDDCVTVEVADVEADSVYKFDIPFDAVEDSIIPFEFMSLTDQRRSEQEL
tara:strand:- start:6839 stop:7072 length:234 start_codon:yes stop_codon:yes gene_type:complete